MKLRHLVTSMLIFGILLGLTVEIYTGMHNQYGLERTDLRDGKDIGQSLQELNFITSFNETATAIYNIKNPTGTPFDIVGALAAASLGVIKSILAFLALPFQIGAILIKFYPIPGTIITGLAVLLGLVTGFLMISAYLRYDT